MAKTKHRSTASQRREEVKSQRQQRLAPTPGKQAQSRNNNRRRRNARQGLPWGLVVGALLVVAAIVVIFMLVANHNKPSSTGGSASSATLAPASVLGPVTNVSPATFAQVGTAGLQNFLVPTNKGGSTPPPLLGPSGRPEFFYYGAEYCPYCAAQRWGIIVALSRFGSFSNLHLATSSADDVYASTPTFTFYKSSYSSKYVDFVSVESDGPVQGQPLQTPSAQEQQLFTTFDGPPYFSTSASIPFINIGNRYLVQGASYDPGVLRTNQNDPSSAPLTQQDIAAALTNPGSPITKGIVGTANYMTAAICQMTKQQPASVCAAAPVPAIEQSLPKVASNNVPAGLSGLASGPLDVPGRRQG